MSVLGYFNGVAAELRKVTWPTFPVMVRYFVSVVLGTAIATAFIWVVDVIFIKALSLLIN